MKKAVKSTDPRKKIVMQKLKQESKASKITSVFEVGQGKFVGDCFSRKLESRAFNLLGTFYVDFELNQDGTLGQHVSGGKLEDVQLTAVPKGYEG